jgi:tetratricopeptide (TPR) repeat protein
MMLLLLRTAILVACTVLVGCATPPERPGPAPDDLFVDAAFAATGVPVDAAEVFALSPAMRHYLDVDIAPMLRVLGRHRGLVEALYSKAHLRLDYDDDSTRTAAEAFDARAGNCLSLVVMTAALAKQLELPIEYQALVGPATWSRQGRLAFAAGHVNITVSRRLIDRVQGTDTGQSMRLDFGALAAGRGAALRPVSEATIVAMFMNNRAAESLVRGHVDQAYAYAREAVRQDAGFAGAYNTLGVVYSQRGLADAAERAWRQALAREPDNVAALSNLAQGLESQGRDAEALPWRLALKHLEAEPPFQQFDLGREALARGDYAAARGHFERALRRDPDYHEFHYHLALALAGLGDRRGAAEHLARAADHSTTRREQALYAGKLERLKAAGTRVN